MRFFRIDESDSSLPSILLYLAVLSFFGGLLGLFVKTRLNNTSSKAEITDDYSLEKKHFHQLQADVQTASQLLENCRKSHREQKLKIDACSRRIAASTAKIQHYQKQQPVLADAIRKAHALREQYRELYRKQAWQSAQSEKHSHIKTTNGKVYHNVTIKQVSMEGVEIEHSSGYARIPPDLLHEEWTQRFLLHVR